MAAIVFDEEVTNAGLTLSYDPTTWGGGDMVLYLYTTSPVTLGANIGISITANFNKGCGITVVQSSDEITRNGRTLDVVLPVGGISYNTAWQFVTPSVYTAVNVDGTNYSSSVIWDVVTPGTGGGIDAATALLDESVTLSKIEDVTSAQIIVGNASNRPTAVAVTGDIAITNAGVTSIAAGAIVNADVNAAAGISVSKLATLTATKPVITDASGFLTTANQISSAFGGLGIDTSASSGFAIDAAGTWSVGELTETLRCDISFVTAAQGTYYVRVPFPCTVTAAKARVTSTVSGTDDGTITLRDNGGTNMTSGLITIPASSAHGVGVTCSPSANNTFTANQEIQLVVAKTTTGGACSVDITITRTTLS